MFESLFEGFKYMENSTKQGIIFAIGMAGYYLVRRLTAANRAPAEKRVNKKSTGKKKK